MTAGEARPAELETPVKIERWHFNVPDAASGPFYKDVYQAAAQLGGLPQSAIRVAFCESLANRSLNYRIYFFPERDGVQGDQWRVGEEGPVEKAYVDDIVAWAKKFRPAVRNGTQNLLP